MTDVAAPRTTLSLQARIVLAIGSVLAVAGIVVMLAALAYGRHAAREAFDRLLVGAASDIAESISIRDGFPIVDMPVSAFELLALAPRDRINYRVVGRDGDTLTGNPAAPRPETTTETPSFYGADFSGEPARYVAVTRLFAERGYSGPVEIIVGHTLHARRDLAFDIAQNAVFALAVAGVVIAVLAWLAVLSTLRPLGRIGAALARRKPTDLSPLAEPAPREVAALRDALNSFIARLRRQLDANRDLIADTAHQLRTPLAAIRLQLDAAYDEADPAERRILMDRAKSRAISLSRLLDQLLSQGLVIHRSDSAPKERLDLRDVALEVYEESEIEALVIDHAMSLDIPEAEVWVDADMLSLTEAGKNLLGNAIRHGVPPIVLGVSRANGAALLWVRDAGSGPAPSVLAGMGRRFANGRSAGAGGLGLAIAHAVAVSHQGCLSHSCDGNGFEISISLPRVAAP
ncbi:sensor histidine kinase [Acuticoccus sp. MNP-M23]|uniref:sensor histidine kinase n=1 Tax=Acuticoccus sp. MNP-M23 TaxID=3072793 RepID=UPI002815B063|nr:sensor histidine kinase [Acuticoccus sp. MNP-M23]WMS41899.1 sensor histidine kinase [Acuticoccus sp. MNP-M23]